jgi:hypothetical protein
MMVGAALMFVITHTAPGFPTWMGVYDYYQRHDGGNPGRFTILMNQSYVGLEANVGYRVNGGAWSEVPMTYVTDVDGNSVWSYQPSIPFPFGATVEFYFHGYDTDPTNQLYDSRDTLNYFAGPLAWLPKQALPMYSVYPNNSLPPTAFATDGEATYLAFAYAGINTNVTVAHQVPGRDWVWSITLDQAEPYHEIDLAADASTLVVAYRTGTGLFARASMDRGTSWSAALPLATLPANGTLSGLRAASGGDGRFAVAYGIATNCCGAQQIAVTVSTNAGASWSTPATAISFNEPGAYATGLKLAGHRRSWYLAVREVYQGSSVIMLGLTSTNGALWTTTSFGGGDNVWSEFDLAVGTNGAVIAADHYQPVTYTWRSTPSGGWTTQTISRALEGGSTLWLGSDGRDTFHLYRFEDNDASPSASTFLPTSRTSTDGGITWSYPRPVTTEKPAPNNLVSLRRVISAGPVQRLVWEHNDYVTIFQRMYSYWMQDSAGYTETVSLEMGGPASFLVRATNLTAGMTHHLQMSDVAGATAWTNLATLSAGATNVAITPSGPGAVYRIISAP